MYFINGFLTLLAVLFVIFMAVKFLPDRFDPKYRVREDVDEIIDEMMDNKPQVIFAMGIGSAVIIIGWPVVHILLGVLLIAFILGGIPYWIISKARSKTPPNSNKSR